jgi:threonine dehydrogenase-like Zn-dependent dehydrogenase
VWLLHSARNADREGFDHLLGTDIDEKLNLARMFGANVAINAKTKDATAQMLKQTGSGGSPPHF